MQLKSKVAVEAVAAKEWRSFLVVVRVVVKVLTAKSSDDDGTHSCSLSDTLQGRIYRDEHCLT